MHSEILSVFMVWLTTSFQQTMRHYGRTVTKMALGLREELTALASRQ